MTMTDDWKDLEFDEEKWETMINSDELFSESSDTNHSRKDILKLSFIHRSNSIFGQSEKFIQTHRTMNILIPPSSHQRVRYENECKQILRYISIPNNGTLTIQIPDLRDILYQTDTLWLRITRTTINHRNDHFLFFHPYPLWIRNPQGRIHHGSIYLPITDNEINNGFIEITTLAMIRSKQEDLKNVKLLNVYSPMQLNSFDRHGIEFETAKQIRDVYQLRQSILHFQLVRVDEENIAYPTDCLCQTGILQEFEANVRGRKDRQRRRMRSKKSKKILRK